MRLELPMISTADDFKRHFNNGVWHWVAAEICARHSISYASLRLSPQGENIIFFVDGRFIVKIYTPFRDGYAREKAALEFANGKLGLETPTILHAGKLEGLSYLVMKQLAGTMMREVWRDLKTREQIEIVSRLGVALKNLHAHAAPLSQPALNRDWSGFIERQAQVCVGRQRACGANPEWLDSLPAYINSHLKLLPAKFAPVMLHGDVHPLNVLLACEGRRWQVTGLFDFADSLCGFHEYEFVAPGVLMMQGNRELQRAFLLAYGYSETQLDLNLRARLMLLTILYECSDLRKYAMRLAPAAVDLTLAELEAAIWTFA
jgi:aminoglycoside phosphotransferase